MKSSTILTLHTAMFAVLLIASPSLTIAVLTYPEVVPSRYVALLCVTGVAVTIGLWRACGECPCTIWEKKALIAEGKIPYDGAWLTNYLYEWFGLRVSQRFGTFFSMALLLMPAVISILNW